MPRFALVAKFHADAAAHGMRSQSWKSRRPRISNVRSPRYLRERTGSIVVPPEALLRSHRNAIASFARTQRLPMAIVGSSLYLAPGCLMSYGPTTAQYAELTARYIDRILRGARPDDLPVEQPSRFELAIDLKTAEAIGLTVPATLLQRADRVIR